MALLPIASVTVKPLHIGFYSPALPDSGASNGIVTYTRVMRDALRTLGHRVTIVTSDQIEHADGHIGEIARPARLTRRIDLLRESRLPQDGSSPATRLKVVRAFKAAQSAGIQVFEIEESFGWAARLRSRGLPIVERLHGPHVFGRELVESAEVEHLGNLREVAELASFTCVQAITCPSRRLLDAVIERYHLNLPKFRVIPNPLYVGTESWSIDQADPDQVLCVGRFDLRKGADLVVRAFARAFERRPSLKLIMAGPDSGLAQSDGTRIRFEQFAEKEIPGAARARIRFLGPQSQAELAQLRRSSALALVGSRFETFPYSVAEAMAFGLPVLTTDCFGAGEMVRDQIDGRVVAVDDVSAMANAIVEMASNPAGLAQMGASARARVAQMLAPERIARETVGLYREVIGANALLR